MDLVKIGKFIAYLRKQNKMTQEQLAEKLGITDRAVSKWERGLSLPDASLMIPLCNELNIKVNELLSGEMIKEEEYIDKADETIIKLEKQKQLIGNVSRYSFGITILILLVWNLINIYLYGVQKAVIKIEFIVMLVINAIYFFIYLYFNKKRMK